MRTTLLRTTTVAAAAALLGLVAYTAPAASAPKGAGGDACYDVIGGAAGAGTGGGTFSRTYEYHGFSEGAGHFVYDQRTDVEAHEHVVHGFRREFAAPEQADAELVVTTAKTAADDCSTVRYRLQVLDESGSLLADLVVPGSASDRVTWRTTVPFAFAEDRFAQFVVTTETPAGRVVDRAPDSGYNRIDLTGAPGAAGWS